MHINTKMNTVFSPIEPPGGKAMVWGGCIRKKGFEGKIALYHLRQEWITKNILLAM